MSDLELSVSMWRNYKTREVPEELFKLCKGDIDKYNFAKGFYLGLKTGDSKIKSLESKIAQDAVKIGEMEGKLERVNAEIEYLKESNKNHKKHHDDAFLWWNISENKLALAVEALDEKDNIIHDMVMEFNKLLPFINLVPDRLPVFAPILLNKLREHDSLKSAPKQIKGEG